MIPTAITVLAFAMATFEGQPGDRNWRNNNPCNLKFANQRHAIDKDPDGFAVFDTLEHGFAAAELQILLDLHRNRLLTFNDLIDQWAPPTDGNLNNDRYAALAASAFGLKPTAHIIQALNMV